MRVTRMETTDLQRVRSDFPALENYTWFQNGGVSITPRPVAEIHAGLMDELLQRGPMHIVYPDEEYPRRERSMARLAEFFGVSPSTLALMRGVSEAFLTVLRGLDWQPGDEIVVSADEEAALLLPVLLVLESGSHWGALLALLSLGIGRLPIQQILRGTEGIELNQTLALTGKFLLLYSLLLALGWLLG